MTRSRTLTGSIILRLALCHSEKSCQYTVTFALSPWLVSNTVDEETSDSWLIVRNTNIVTFTDGRPEAWLASPRGLRRYAYVEE